MSGHVEQRVTGPFSGPRPARVRGPGETPARRSGTRGAVERLLALQRTAGNRAVGALLAPLALQRSQTLTLTLPRPSATTASGSPDPDPGPGGSSTTTADVPQTPRGPTLAETNVLESDRHRAGRAVLDRFRNRLAEISHAIAAVHPGSRYLGEVRALADKVYGRFLSDPGSLGELAPEVAAASRLVFLARPERQAYDQRTTFLRTLDGYRREVEATLPGSRYLAQIDDLKAAIDQAYRDDPATVAGFAGRVGALSDVGTNAKKEIIERYVNQCELLIDEAGKDRRRVERIEAVVEWLREIDVGKTAERIHDVARGYMAQLSSAGKVAQSESRAWQVVYTGQYGCIYDVAFRGLDDQQQDKFRRALDKGPATAQGQDGIKPYQGKPYTHELKIYGAHGNARIYGKKIGNIIHFYKYERSTH